MTGQNEITTYTETIGEMLYERDVPIPVGDVELRANVFRPVIEGEYPVIITNGPYGKDVHFEDGFESILDGQIRLKRRSLPAQNDI